MDNKRLFLAALLSVAVLLLWQNLFPVEPVPSGAPPGQEAPVATPAPPASEEAPAERDPAGAGESSGAGDEGATGGDSEAGASDGESVEPADPDPAEAPAVAASSESTHVLESDRYRATFSNRGAQLVSFVLKNHSDGRNGGSTGVNLVKRRRSELYPFGVAGTDGRGLALNEALFEVTEDGDELRFTYSGPLGRAEKSFAIGDEGLLLVRAEVSGESDWALYFGPGLRNPSAQELESRFSRRTAVYYQDGEVERQDSVKTDEVRRVAASGLGWIGLEDTYFASIWVPTEALAGAEIRPVWGRVSTEDDGPVFEEVAAAEREDDDVARELELLIFPAGAALEGNAFLGAKEYARLSKLPYNLKEAVNLGFFAVLARPLLAGLRWIHDNVTSNYGWAIILMTLLIRIVLFPLTHKSFVSMQKMQELNPKVQATRNKYRGKLKDKQGRPNVDMQRKMNEEVMALYKKEGVNPAGGCLPMLLQIPVLFAFYNLLSAAVELRHAPWILWIKDLSAPDPIYALPIIMGASQFVQQKLTPTAADPMQRRIFMLMPIFFTVLFLGFPSGLVLYWLTNNLLGIVQQGAYKKLRARKAAESSAPKKGKGTKTDKGAKDAKSKKA